MNAPMSPRNDLRSGDETTTLSHISRVWNFIEKARVGMLTTRFASGLRARPLEARADRNNGVIWFVTDARSAKDEEIEAAPEIGLVFIDDLDHTYLSISGRASVVRDITKTNQIWRKTDDDWFAGGRDDPNVRLLRSEPTAAELWDGWSSAIAVAFNFVDQR